MELTEQTATQIWMQAIEKLSGMVADQARHFDSVAILAPNRLVIRFKSGYALFKSACERPEQVAKFEKALTETAGRQLRVEFAILPEEAAESESAGASTRAISPHQRRAEVMRNPLMQRAVELFGADVKDVIEPPKKQ